MKNLAISLESGNKTLDELSDAMSRQQQSAAKRSESDRTPLMPEVSPSAAQQRDIDALKQRIAAIRLKTKLKSPQYLKPIKTHFEYPRDSMENNVQTTKRFSQFHKQAQSVRDLAEVHSLIMTRYKTSGGHISEEHSEDEEDGGGRVDSGDDSDDSLTKEERLEIAKRKQDQEEQGGMVMVEYDTDDGMAMDTNQTIRGGEGNRTETVAGQKRVLAHQITASKLLKPESIDCWTEHPQEMKQLKDEMITAMQQMMEQEIAGTAGNAGTTITSSHD